MQFVCLIVTLLTCYITIMSLSSLLSRCQHFVRQLFKKKKPSHCAKLTRCIWLNLQAKYEKKNPPIDNLKFSQKVDCQCQNRTSIDGPPFTLQPVAIVFLYDCDSIAIVMVPLLFRVWLFKLLGNGLWEFKTAFN